MPRNHLLRWGNFMRSALIAVAVVLSLTGSVHAQNLSALDGGNQLRPIRESLIKDLGGLLELASSRGSNCDQMRTVTYLVVVVQEAIGSIEAAEVEMRIYSVV